MYQMTNQDWKDNFQELKRLYDIEIKKNDKLRTKNRELEQKIELLKKFSILGELINEKKFICNLR